MHILLDNLRPIGILFITLLLSFGLFLIAEKIFQYLSQKKPTSRWKENYLKMRFALIGTVFLYGLGHTTSNLNLTFVSQKTIAGIESIIILIWVLLIAHALYRLASAANWIYRTLLFSLFSIGVIYQFLVVWDLALPLFGEHSVSSTLPNLVKSWLAIPISLFIAVVYAFIGNKLIRPFVRKTRTDLDEFLYEICHRPIITSIVLVGCGHTVSHLDFQSDYWASAIKSILLTIAILIWAKAGTKSSTTITAYSKEHFSWSFIKKETEPIFNIGAKIIITLAALYCLLLAWHIDPTAWLASAGIIGIAITYASQDTLSSLLGGISILTDQPYAVGDFLILENGVRGKVTEIGFRSTRLLTPDDIQIVIPNSSMATTQITNMTGGPYIHARIDCAAGVAYGSNIDRVREILLSIAQDLDYVVKNQKRLTPQVHFISMGASSLDFVLRVWLTDPEYFAEVQNQANTLIYKRFTAENIEIPYSKQDVYLYPMKSFPKNGASTENQ